MIVTHCHITIANSNPPCHDQCAQDCMIDNTATLLSLRRKRQPLPGVINSATIFVTRILLFDPSLLCIMTKRNGLHWGNTVGAGPFLLKPHPYACVAVTVATKVTVASRRGQSDSTSEQFLRYRLTTQGEPSQSGICCTRDACTVRAYRAGRSHPRRDLPGEGASHVAHGVPRTSVSVCDLTPSLMARALAQP
jgi:hypothetical protein